MYGYKCPALDGGKIQKAAVVAALSSALVLTSCKTIEDEKSVLGVIGGTVTALTAGICVAKAGDSVGAIGLCAVLGVFAGELTKAFGGEIMKGLKEKDQEKVVAATSEALRTGEPQTLELPDSDAIIEIVPEPTNRTYAERELPISVETADVSEVPPKMLAIGETRSVLRSANLRAGPGTNFGKLELLSAGEKVHVYGKLENSNWFMIGKRASDDIVGDGPVVVGYVYSTLVASSPSLQTVEGEQIPAEFAWREPKEMTPTVEDRPVTWRASCTPTTLRRKQQSDASNVREEAAVLCQGPVGPFVSTNDAVS